MVPANLLAMMVSLLAMPKSLRDDRAQNPIKDLAIAGILFAVAILITLVILPLITSQVSTAQADPNVTSTDGTLLGLIPTMFIVGIVGSGVAFLVKGFRGLG